MFFFFHIYHLIWSYNKPQYLSLASLVRGDCYVNRVDDFHNCLLTTFADLHLLRSQIIVLVTRFEAEFFHIIHAHLISQLRGPPALCPDSPPICLASAITKCSKIQNRPNVSNQKPCRYENSSSVMEGWSTM